MAKTGRVESIFDFTSVRGLYEGADPKTVAAYMRTGVVFNTVIGDIAFDDKGDIKQVAYVMYTWTKQPDGRITYVQN